MDLVLPGIQSEHNPADKVATTDSFSFKPYNWLTWPDMTWLFNDSLSVFDE